MVGRHKCIKETEIALLKQRAEEDHKMLVEVHAAVIGEKDQPGIKGRVDRIETTQSNIVKGVTIFGTIMSICVAIVAIFKRV